jgi:hypothetical protein
MRLLSPIALFIAASLVLTGCPKGGSSSTSGDQETVQEAPKSRFSGVTKAYVDALMSTAIVGWMVADDGAPVIYETLTLTEGGGFTAKTTVKIGDEPFECTESGTWSLDGDQAESKTIGNLNFELTQTDCAGRTAPMSWRAQTTVADNDVNFELR